MAKPDTSTARQKLISRLTGYWRIEAANALLVPVFMVLVADGRIGVGSIAAILPMMALLIIGAAYWRAKLHQIEHGTSPDKTVKWIAALDFPMAIASAVAIAVCISLWSIDGLAVGTADRWVATAAAVLAALEYINYYHRQLQHFDHWADWKRLIAGGGFRKSQLRQDIDRLKITARSSPDQKPR
ncbi:hypothetical protein FGU71_04275 [Erythrobacter insulae]|uniref:Uncharacterized protein n=1 Tax=Erythrobacter insulae TaxID=2584124 RepID=A0A547PAU4_9SPHN|nr:hypothetical protein [Erythrobacter insulae]TRD11144.1 hypothetical protein FGU71_04275 [Erythrobacter insulae]